MSKCFIVVGMHGSATSLVAAGLHSQVRWPCEPPAEDRRWLCEDRRMVRLNEMILRSAGGTWRQPPGHERVLAQAERFSASMCRLVRELRGDADLWGWKDPRTTLTAELWLPHVENPHLIAVFRQPVEVAGTLARTHSMDEAEATALIRLYNERALRLLEGFA